MEDAQPYVPAPVPAVVGPQYCLPYEIGLTVIKKAWSFTGADFIINDANGHMAFKVDGHFRCIMNKRVLSDSTGNALLCAECELGIFQNRWVVYRGDGSQNAEKLFSLRRSAAFGRRTSLVVFSNTSEKEPDFRVKSSKGNFSERKCTVFHGTQKIAEVKRKFTAVNLLLPKHTFIVTVFPGVDHAFIAMLIVIMYKIYRRHM